MSTILINLLTALLLFQAVAGWCCHRPCSERAGGVDRTVETHRHCCHGVERRAPQAPADSPRECDDCLAFCIFIAERPAEFEASELLSTVALLTAFVDVGQVVVGPLVDWRFVGQRCAPPPPVRLHLLHQLLLV